MLYGLKLRLRNLPWISDNFPVPASSWWRLRMWGRNFLRVYNELPPCCGYNFCPWCCSCLVCEPPCKRCKEC